MQCDYGDCSIANVPIVSYQTQFVTFLLIILKLPIALVPLAKISIPNQIIAIS